MSHRSNTFVVLMVALVLLAPVVPFAAAAETLRAVGGDGRLWVLRSAGAGRVAVYHRGAADSPSRLLRVETLEGTLQPAGVAAWGSELWLAYADGTVQSIRAEPSPMEPGVGFVGSLGPPLPRGAEVRAMAATTHGPWALVALSPEQAAAMAGQPAAEPSEGAEPASRGDALRNLSLGLPPGADPVPLRRQAPPPEASAGPEAAEDGPLPPVEPDGDNIVEGAGAEPPPDAKPVERLLRLRGGRWHVVTLPGDWPAQARVWLAADELADDLWPTLVAEAPGGGGGLWVYERNGDAWVRETYEVPAERLDAVIVQGQLAVVAAAPSDGGITASVSLLRAGRSMPVGGLTLPDASPDAWDAAAAGLTVAVVATTSDPPAADEPRWTAALTGRGEPLGLVWGRIDLRGDVVQEPALLERFAPQAWASIADGLVLAVIAALTVAMLVVLRRRNPALNRPELPEGVVVADLPRRALAALIDLVPVAVVVMQVYGLGLRELVTSHWPGSGATSLVAVLPGLWVVLGFALHTTLSELFTDRTLGKAVTGLRVSDVRGERPRAWQTLVRGALRIVDLVAPLLLILPLLGPFRQRLADVLAHTIVVAHLSEEEQSTDPDEPEDGS